MNPNEKLFLLTESELDKVIEANISWREMSKYGVLSKPPIPPEPLKLPTDEEIEKQAKQITPDFCEYCGCVEGIKWLRDQILNEKK